MGRIFVCFRENKILAGQERLFTLDGDIPAVRYQCCQIPVVSDISGTISTAATHIVQVKRDHEMLFTAVCVIYSEYINILYYIYNVYAFVPCTLALDLHTLNL